MTITTFIVNFEQHIVPYRIHSLKFCHKISRNMIITTMGNSDISSCTIFIIIVPAEFVVNYTSV